MGEVFELSPHFSARIGNPPATFDGALERLGLSGTHFAGRAKLGGLDVFVKYRTIRPASRMRIFTRRFVEGFAAPRVIEYRNLRALENRGVAVVPPVLAASTSRLGLVRRELLVSAWLEDSPDVAALAADSESGRLESELAGAVGRAVARMHGAGFRHRDLFLRNLVATRLDVDEDPADGGYRISLLDCHKGSFRHRPLRGVAYDLACLDLDASTLLDHGSRVELLEACLAAAETYGGPAELERLLERVERARRGLALRIHRRKRPGHRKGRLPALDPVPLSTLLSARRTSVEDLEFS